MTTEPENDTAQALAAALTAGEITHLKEWVNVDRYFVNEHEKDLAKKGLIKIVRIDHRRHQVMFTDLGKRVLAVLDSAARPTVITAQQFVEQGYAAKIARGECVVKSPLYREEIISAEFIKPNSAKWDIAITDTRGTYRTYTTQELLVTWLPTATAQAADPTPASAAGDDWNAVIDDERLRIIKDAFDLSQPIAPAAIQLNIMHKEIVTLRAALETALRENSALRMAISASRQSLRDISEMAGASQGEWVAVQPEYAPIWANEFKAIEDRVEQIFDELNWKRGYGTEAEYAQSTTTEGEATK